MEKLLKKLQAAIWQTDIKTLPRYKALALQSVRLALTVLDELGQGQLTLRAMSLVYTTLLALIPLLAVSFAILKAFGVHNQVEPFLLNLLQPLGQKGVEISNNIIRFVENIRVGVLGILGVVFLFYTAISLIQKIEGAFNYIWHCRHTKSFLQRFSNYLSVLMVGPLLLFLGLGLTASMASATLVQKIIAVEPFGTLFYLGGQLLPYLFIITAFLLMYLFIPSARVKFRPALLGAVVAGILWKTAGWWFASFVAGSARYDAVYSSFAILVIFMIWLYVSWLIVFSGAQLAYNFQHIESIYFRKRQPALSNAQKENVCIAVMLAIARHHYQGDAPVTREALADLVSLPPDYIEAFLDRLMAHNLVAETSDDPAGYLPAREISQIRLDEVVQAVRLPVELEVHSDLVDSAMSVSRAMEQGLEQALKGRTLLDLVQEQPALHSVATQQR